MVGNQKYNNKIVFPLIILLTFAAVISLLWHPNLLAATLLFLGLPSIYLSFLNSQFVGRAIAFSLLAASSFGLTVDYLGTLAHLWVTTDSVFSFKLFGSIPLENPIWSFFFVYLVVMLFETLTPKSRNFKIKKQFFLLVVLLFSLEVVIHWSFGSTKTITSLSYLYMTLGTLLFLLPLIVFLTKFKQYCRSFVSVAVCCLPITFLNEVISLHNGYWLFPASTKFIARFNFWDVNFPVEELLFFVIIGAPAILTYYIYFFRGVEPNN